MMGRNGWGVGGSKGVAPEGRQASEAGRGGGLDAGVAFHACCCSAADVPLRAAGKPADLGEKFVAPQMLVATFRDVVNATLHV